MGDNIETANPARNPSHSAPRFALRKPLDRHRT